MTIKYYKSSAPEVLAANQARQAAAEALRLKGVIFKEHFGAQGLVSQNNTHAYCIAGLVFDPPKPSRLWTVPDKQSCGMQRPRQSIKKPTPEEKAELADLKAHWAGYFPEDRVDFAPVLEAMGTSWGNLIFGAFSYFEYDGVIYVATSAGLNDKMVEIVASEFETAQVASKKELP